MELLLTNYFWIVILLATPELLRSEEVLHFLAATPNDFALRKVGFDLFVIVCDSS